LGDPEKEGGLQRGRLGRADRGGGNGSGKGGEGEVALSSGQDLPKTELDIRKKSTTRKKKRSKTEAVTVLPKTKGLAPEIERRIIFKKNN